MWAHRSVGQKPGGFEWVLRIGTLGQSQGFGWLVTCLEGLGENLLPKFMLVEFSSMPSWDWRPCFLAGCCLAVVFNSQGLLFSYPVCGPSIFSASGAMPGEHEDRDQGRASTSQGMPRLAAEHQESHGKDYHSAFGRNQPWFQALSSRTVRPSLQCFVMETLGNGYMLPQPKFAHKPMVVVARFCLENAGF